MTVADRPDADSASAQPTVVIQEAFWARGVDSVHRAGPAALTGLVTQISHITPFMIEVVSNAEGLTMIKMDGTKWFEDRERELVTRIADRQSADPAYTNGTERWLRVIATSSHPRLHAFRVTVIAKIQPDRPPELSPERAGQVVEQVIRAAGHFCIEYALAS